MSSKAKVKVLPSKAGNIIIEKKEMCHLSKIITYLINYNLLSLLKFKQKYSVWFLTSLLLFPEVWFVGFQTLNKQLRCLFNITKWTWHLGSPSIPHSLPVTGHGCHTPSSKMNFSCPRNSSFSAPHPLPRHFLHPCMCTDFPPFSSLSPLSPFPWQLHWSPIRSVNPPKRCFLEQTWPWAMWGQGGVRRSSYSRINMAS